MAVDALEYDDDEGKPAEALDEILESPERLRELDLEAFAVELGKQGFGKKNTTLYDIRSELNSRYADLREPFVPPTPHEVFQMLTKESPDTFYNGKMVQVWVTDFIHRKPQAAQLDDANPVRNEETGLWQCPFCLKNDFPELSEVWNHFDENDCPGQAIGVKTRLDNGIFGFISIKNLSDKTVTNPADRVRRQSVIYARILNMDPEKFSVELSSRSSVLQDVENKYKPEKDPGYYDYVSEKNDKKKLEKKMEKKKTQYLKRIIRHPSFENVDYKEAEKLMLNLEQGEAIFRPSSKGVDHLTLTWKVAPEIYQHIDIKELDKENDFLLGKKLLINKVEFEDLNEILASFVAPLAANARQILEHKYYREALAGQKGKISEILREEKKKNPKNIPYMFTASELPGKFVLSWAPPSSQQKVYHEYVGVMPEGFKFSHQPYPTLNRLIEWFKKNYRNLNMPRRQPTNTPGRLTNRSMYIPTPATCRTPKAPSMGNPTPMYTPYTPSGQTPFLTPNINSPGMGLFHILRV